MPHSGWGNALIPATIDNPLVDLAQFSEQACRIA
jgi:hypothetical protein